MKTRIFSPDIECDSCFKIISKVLERIDGVSYFSMTDSYVDIEYNDKKVHIKELVDAIKKKGYRADVQPYTRKRIGERAKEFLQQKEKYHIEYKMLANIVISFIVLLLINGVIIYANSLANPNFLKLYGWWIFYLALTIATLGGAIWHFKSYKTSYTCMVGMMVGMTIGMQSGMMIGAVLGVTNGFFTGALVAMLIGSCVGGYCGNCCGIMGIMEGIMAGVMGGTMGAMISVMMFNEHILWFMPPYILLNIIILIGLSYMIFEEVVEDNEAVIKTPISRRKFLLYSIVSYLLLLAIMFYTPASIFLG